MHRLNVTIQANALTNRAFVNASASGSVQLVPSQAGLRVRVLAVSCVASAAMSVKFLSNGTDISATYAIAANGGFVMPEIVSGWFQTAPGEALNFSADTSAAVGVHVVWMTVA